MRLLRLRQYLALRIGLVARANTVLLPSHTPWITNLLPIHYHQVPSAAVSLPLPLQISPTPDILFRCSQASTALKQLEPFLRRTSSPSARNSALMRRLCNLSCFMAWNHKHSHLCTIRPYARSSKLKVLTFTKSCNSFTKSLRYSYFDSNLRFGMK